MLYLFLSRLELDDHDQVLHLAPEKGVFEKLSKKLVLENYVTADIQPEFFNFAPKTKKIDLCELEDQPSNKYKYIINSHILEHIPCNIAYSLWHLHRMLTEDGIHFLVVPFVKGKYDECFQDLPPAVRSKRFGQEDHMRNISIDDLDQHLGKILSLPKDFDATLFFTEEELKDANIPEPFWRGYSMNSVIMLKKYDMKLLSA
ncbi:MAG: methyltransferase domain-containing protein [Roseibium sp.]|nr:methyltransferase domain-containing protein [Roseibium sp.]